MQNTSFCLQESLSSVSFGANLLKNTNTKTQESEYLSFSANYLGHMKDVSQLGSQLDFQESFPVPPDATYLESEFDEEDLANLAVLRSKGRRVIFCDDDEEVFHPIPTKYIPLAELQDFTCDCNHHPIDTDKDVLPTTAKTYSDVVKTLPAQNPCGPTMQLKETPRRGPISFKPQGISYINGDEYATQPNLYLPVGKVRVVNSILNRPDVYVYSPSSIELKCANEDLPQMIERMCLNMAIGWEENNVWGYDGVIRKGRAKPCTRCAGFISDTFAVLDTPCYHGMKSYHNANVETEKTLLANSMGFRLGKSEYLTFDYVPKKCGFRGQNRVYSVEQGSWIVEAVAMYGMQQFSFSKSAFEEMVVQLPRFAKRVGGIHPGVCLQISRFLTSLPNARVLLQRMARNAPSRAKTTIVEVEGGFMFDFRPAPKTELTITEFTRRHLPAWFEKIHVAVETFKCEKCRVSCNNLHQLEQHLASSEHAKRTLFKHEHPFDCSACMLSFPTLRDWEKHGKTAVHIAREKIFEAQANEVIKELSRSAPIAISWKKHDGTQEHIRYIKSTIAHGVPGNWPHWYHAQGFEWLETLQHANSLVTFGVDTIFALPVWDAIIALFGGKKMTRPEKEFIVTSLFLSLENSTTSKIHGLVQTMMVKDRLSVQTCVLGLFMKASIYLYKIFSSPKVYDAQGVSEQFWGSLRLLMPGLEPAIEDKIAIVQELRAAALARSALKDYWLFAKFFLEWILKWVRVAVVSTPDELQAWVDKVDKIDEVFMSDNGATTLKVQLTKFHQERRKIYQLLQQGKVMKKKLESLGQASFLLTLLNERVKKLQAIIAKNTGSYVGAEGKLKPHLIYFWGAPKVGKSVMIDHFYSDLFEALGEEEYNPGSDRYTLNPLNEFHDAYQYNRVVDIQDFFQMKGEEIRQEEVYNLVHMADETPYPMNIAECSGKGSVFFCSDHMAITSNFDMATRTHDIESLTESFSAVLRRIDVYVEVFRDTSNNPGYYDRESMSFLVGKPEERKKQMKWYEFIEYCAKSVLSVRARSMGITCVSKDNSIKERLRAIKEKCFVAQGLYNKDRLYEYVELIKSKLATPWKQRYWIGMATAAYYVGLGPDVRCAYHIMRYRDWCAESVGVLLTMAVKWAEVVAVGAILLGLFKYYKNSNPNLMETEARYPTEQEVRMRKTKSHILAEARYPSEQETRMRKSNPRHQAEARYPSEVEARMQRKSNPRMRSEGDNKAGPLKLVAQGCKAPNMLQVRQTCASNLGRVYGPTTATQCFGLFGYVVAIPEHVVNNLATDTLRFVVKNSVVINVPLAEVARMKVLTSHHLILLDLTPWLKNYPPFCDISRRVWDNEQQLCSTGLMITSRAGFHGSMEYWGILIDGLKVMDHTAVIQKKDGTQYRFSKAMLGYGASENGDCGAPWIMDTPIGALIVGLHIGGTKNQEMSAGYLDRNIVNMMKEYFKEDLIAPVEFEANGTEFDPVDDAINTVEVLGETSVSVFQPRKTKIMPSPFSGLIEPRTAPAVLKRTLVQQEDGTFVKVSPLVLNFQKNFFVKKNLSERTLGAALDLLKDWYLPHGKPRKDRRVLTIEEAIFGDPDDVRNKSIDAHAGVGWPWNEKFKNRENLMNLQDKTVHPALREACAALMDGTTKEEFLFLDMLKDERLPLEKVVSMKTRVFTILPIHVNIVLKQLFGHFVMYIMEKQQTHPVKLGISQTPKDWTALYEFLNNGGQYIAGDYSAFDKSLHYEIMSYVCKMVNEFYDDEFSELRASLLKRIFCGYHLIDTSVYQTFGGMPSGCYLTASFNSLCNVMYWYAFLVEKKIDTSFHCDWFRPAVFGDDHVVAVYKRPEINQKTFSEWLKSLGMKYTTATKHAVEADYTPFDEVSFLKRTFRYDGLRWWGPLDIDSVIDSAQWYKNTAVARQLTTEEKCQQILDQIELELVHHGKEVFEYWQNKMINYTRYDLTKVARRFETVQNVFLNADPNLTLFTMNDKINEINFKEDVQNACAFDLTFEGQGLELDPPQEAATFLGDTISEDIVQGLTHFTDQTVGSTAPATKDLCTVVDDMFEIPRDFFKMCNRWLTLGRYTITTGDPTGGPVLRIDPMNYLIEDKFIRDKISSTTFVRYKMEVQLKLVATKYHYGAFMVVWRPYYAAGQAINPVFGWNNPVTFEDNYVVAMPPATKRRYSPYDSIFTASQCEHTIMSVTAKNTVRIKVPWTVPYQYVPTALMTEPRFHPGYLDVYAITPTGPSNIDAPEFAIFVAFTEVRGWGYKSEANPPRRLRYINAASSAAVTPEIQSVWEVPLPVMPSTMMDPVSWSRWAAGTPITSWRVKQFEAQGDTIQETKAQTTGSWLLDTAFWIVDTGRTVLTMFTPLGPLLGFFGLSRPADAEPIKRMIVGNLPMSNALGPDVCYTTAMNPYNLLEQDETPEDKLISTLGATPTYLGYFSFEPGKLSKRAYSVSPMHVKTLGDDIVSTPAAYIADKFRYWRSNVRWYLRFYSSSFVSLRVAVYITYNDVGGKIGLVPTRVVDINGDAECDIDLPFMHQTPWYDSLTDTSNMYNITIEPITDIVSDEASETKPVYCALWISFPSLQVAGPCPRQFANVSYTGLPISVYDAQGIDLPGLGTSDVTNGAKWAMNDIPASIYHLAKRYSPTGSKKLKPWLPPSRIGKADKSNLAIYVDDGPWYMYYAKMFRFFRTSINTIGKVVDVEDYLAQYGESFRDGPSLNDWSFTSSYNLAPMNMAHTRVPFRANVSYFPTPTASVYAVAENTTDATTGELKTFSVTDIKWANQLENGSIGVKIGSGGIITTDTSTTSASNLFVAAADDLTYHTFIGVPLWRYVKAEILVR